MLFDTDSKNSLKKIKTCQKSNVIRLTLPFLLLLRLLEEMLLFPNFQRSFGRYQPPFFETECKGKGPFISTKFFSTYFPINPDSFGVKINLFCEELPTIFSGGGQRYGFINYQQTFSTGFVHI
jgi:hypothetical protein